MIGDLLKSGFNLLHIGLSKPTFTFKGVAYPCVPNTLEENASVEIGGRLVDIRFRLFVKKADLVAEPKTGEFGYYRGEKFKLLPVVDDPSGAYWRLDLQDINR